MTAHKLLTFVSFINMDGARRLKYVLTSKGGYLNKQWFSSVVSLFKMGTTLKGKISLQLTFNSSLSWHQKPMSPHMAISLDIRNQCLHIWLSPLTSETNVSTYGYLPWHQKPMSPHMAISLDIRNQCLHIWLECIQIYIMHNRGYF